MKTPSELKNIARTALSGKWTDAVLATLVYILIAGILSEGTSIASLTGIVIPANTILGISGGTLLVSLLALGPLSVGFENAFRVLLTSGDKNVLSNSFQMGFKNYKHIVLGYLLMEVKIFLWTLCLIIPGIIKSFSYAMTPFILVDNPELGLGDAIEKSSNMMKGHKFDLFYFYLTYIGWFLLCLLTLGIGLFWLVPYVQTGLAAFYEDLKAEYSTIEG